MFELSRSRKNLALLLALLELLATAAIQAQEASQPGSAPTAPKQVARAQSAATTASGATRGGMTVDVSSRRQSLAFYQNVYLASENVSSGWTGSLAQGNAGTTTQAFRDATVRRINYFRAMVGVPADIFLSDPYNAADQQAALMISTNGQINHTPPSSWLNYTAAGADAARNSNLYLSVNGPAAITGYIQDPGDINFAVGHRRWILYPQTVTMGTGDVEGTAYGSLGARANALRVQDGSYGTPRPATRDGFVAWPPPGYVPYPLVFARWSFSYPDADFSQAQVSMTSAGKTLALTQATPVASYGENTLVWTPQGVVLGPDDPRSSVPVEQQEQAYNVTVSNVLVNGAATSFSYTVRPFDPVQPGTGEPPTFFAGERLLGRGIYYLDFPAGNIFGYYAYLPDPKFIYHFDMGYEYVIDALDRRNGMYLYDFTSGDWFYTSPTFPFPYLYDFTLNAFLFYYPDPNPDNLGRYNTDGTRYFFNFATRQIIKL